MPTAAPGSSQVYIHGLRDLQRTFRYADKQSRKFVRDEFKGVAEPVARDAEGLAREKISHVGEKWPRMRVGVTTKLVYVAPRQRGIRQRDDPRKRPKLADLLMEKAMEPALQRNASEIEHAVERTLDRLADRFNSGGRL